MAASARAADGCGRAFRAEPQAPRSERTSACCCVLVQSPAAVSTHHIGGSQTVVTRPCRLADVKDDEYSFAPNTELPPTAIK